MDDATSRSRVSRGHDAGRADRRIRGDVSGSLGCLQEQGGPELGEVVAVDHSIGEDELVLSAGIEVQEDFSPQEPLALLELGGCESGMIDHFGPYLFADFRRTQSQLEDELAADGRTSSGMVIERYLTVPDAEPDQSKWQTEIWLPRS